MTDVLHGQGAITLRHVPQDRHKRPRIVASATYAIADLRYSEDSAERDVDSGAATIAAVNTAITAGAGPGETDPHRIIVTANTNIATGRSYLLVGADGNDELVSVRAIDTLNVYTHLALRQDFASGATLRAVELTASFPAAEANDDVEIETAPHPYQVVWTYTIDADIHVVDEIVWLSRTSGGPIVDELYVLNGYPTMGQRLRARADISSAITVATDDYNAEVTASGKDPRTFRGNETARVAVRARALQRCFEWCGGGEHDVRQAERYEAQFKYLMAQLLFGTPRPRTTTVDQPSNTATQDVKSSHQILRRR